jgi:hypothetical protein
VKTQCRWRFSGRGARCVSEELKNQEIIIDYYPPRGHKCDIKKEKTMTEESVSKIIFRTNDDRMIADSCRGCLKKTDSSLRVFISEEQTKETDEMKAVPKDEDSPLGLIYQ